MAQEEIGEIEELHLGKEKRSNSTPVGEQHQKEGGHERTYQTLVDEIFSKIDQTEGKHKLQQALITGIKRISTLNGNVLQAKA